MEFTLIVAICLIGVVILIALRRAEKRPQNRSDTRLPRQLALKVEDAKERLDDVLAELGMDETITQKANEFQAGKSLFELGVGAANKEDFKTALEYYTKSIDVREDPSAYLNRARILFKRIRYWEGLQDLQKARDLELEKDRLFIRDEINQEIDFAEAMVGNYRNGIREKLLEDFDRRNDIGPIAIRILEVSFSLPEGSWGVALGMNPIFEFHFFNDLDNIRLFDELQNYPTAKEYLQLYPEDFLQRKINESIDEDTYKKAELMLHGFLCSYDEKRMYRLREYMLYRMHDALLSAQYGSTGLSSDCPGVTRDAYEYLIENKLVERGDLVG